MKCQILFSGKNLKNITNLSSAEFVHRVVTVKDYLLIFIHELKQHFLQRHSSTLKALLN